MIPMEVVVTMATAGGSWIMKKSSQDAADRLRERELTLKALGQQTDAMDAASKRSSPWLRKFAAITILLTTFGGMFVLAFFPNIPTQILHEVPAKEFLFGLIKWGGGLKVVSAYGFVQPEWVRYSVCAVIGFLFGPGFAKTR